MTAPAWPDDDAAYGLHPGGPEALAAEAPVFAGHGILSPIDLKELKEDGSECRDLQERYGHRMGRHPLTDPREKTAKLHIETGTTLPDGRVIRPKEPFDCPEETGILLFRQWLMSEPPGSVRTRDLTRKARRALRWMCEQELAYIDRGYVWMLSDLDRSPGRSYPGAPVSDRKAAVGRRLGQVVRELVKMAQAQIAARLNGLVKGRKKQLRRGKLRENGIQLANPQLAEEINEHHAEFLTALGLDPAEFRYVSVKTIQRVIREMLKAGELGEAEPPRHTRHRRSWFTVPRVFALLTEAATLFPVPASGPPPAAPA